MTKLPVAALMGSDSDLAMLEACFEVLQSPAVPFQGRAINAALPEQMQA